jgi:hypothetical protein
MRRPSSSHTRRLVLAASIGAATTLGGAYLAVRADLSMSHTAAMSIASSLRSADSWIGSVASASDPASVSIRDAVAVTYIERHRLGLGSPFRLIDQAGHDRRLSPEVRRELGWTLLSRTLRGDGYEIDSLALDPRHLHLIERAVAEAETPETGELAVRLSYRLAAAERLIPGWLPGAADEAAALIRDRRVAQDDARRLVASARSGDVEALALLPLWRQQRRFAVEAPPRSLRPDREEDAIARADALLRQIRGLAAAPAADPAAGRGGELGSLLSRAAARRLEPLSANYLPPQSSVVLAVRTHADIFADSALNEETLVTQRTLAGGAGNGARRMARATLAAAAGLRAMAQEVVWLPGNPGPSETTMRAELPGVTVQFDTRVREAWQPYYRKMLVSAVRDLRRVFPTLALDGLRVRFIEEDDARAALALHDPSKRTLYLPVRTAAGVLAHELAHDLDWQAARTMYGRRGSYSTDIALAEGKGSVNDRLRGLASATLVTPRADNGWYAPHDRRPAEVFARNFDWLVAAALSRDGRSNGYLTSVQDEVLVGHAAVLPQEVGGTAVVALMDLLEDVASPLGTGLRHWLISEWGGTRSRRPTSIVRALADAPAPSRSATGTLSVADQRGGCVRIARMAAESRARGILAAQLSAVPVTERSPLLASMRGDAPWSSAGADMLRESLSTSLLEQFEHSSPSNLIAGCGDVLAAVR